jgi:hypothetical protein
LKIKLKGCHFYTIEVTEAETQAMPNTASRMRLRNGRSAGSGAYVRVILARRSKLISDQMAAPVPEIMEGSVYV